MSTAAALRGFSASTDKHVLKNYMDLEQPDDKVMCEYIWIDGTGEGIRSKCKTLDFEPKEAKGESLAFVVDVHDPRDLYDHFW